MINPFWQKLEKKHLFIMVLVILVFLIYGLSRLFFSEKIVPEKLLAEAIQKTMASNTFRYYLEVKLDKQGVLSRVEGKWVAPDQVYIKGTMYKTPVEFIQMGDTTYMRDIWTKKWLDLKGNKLGQAQLFVMELEPFYLLSLRDMVNVRYQGREKLKEGNMHVVECQANLQNPLINEAKYYCKLWIDPKDRRIRQAFLESRNFGGREIPVVTLKLWDFNQPMSIEPPQMN